MFVFALTQVTALMAADVTGKGLLRGVLLIAVVWWCWVGYSWLSNVVKADEGAARVTMLVAMSSMFLLALVSLGVLTVVLIALNTVESIRFRSARDEIRHAAHPE